LAWVLASSVASAQERSRDNTHYLGTFELHTAAELRSLLLRAENLLLDGVMTQNSAARVTLLMHGPEVKVLLRDNYRANQGVVDLAARLSALGIVEIKACETWMGGNRVDVRDLQPFVETVPYGPAEARRLVAEESYLAF
jgi:intracellular sulfur oxidation DsrE/DsrF family protein